MPYVNLSDVNIYYEEFATGETPIEKRGSEMILHNRVNPILDPRTVLKSNW